MCAYSALGGVLALLALAAGSEAAGDAAFPLVDSPDDDACCTAKCCRNSKAACCAGKACPTLKTKAACAAAHCLWAGGTCAPPPPAPKPPPAPPGPKPPPAPPPGAAWQDACAPGTAGAALKFCDASLTMDARLDDLVPRVHLNETAAQLTARESPLVESLGIPSCKSSHAILSCFCDLWVSFEQVACGKQTTGARTPSMGSRCVLTYL